MPKNDWTDLLLVGGVLVGAYFLISKVGEIFEGEKEAAVAGEPSIIMPTPAAYEEFGTSGNIFYDVGRVFRSWFEAALPAPAPVELWPEAAVQEMRAGCYEFGGTVYCEDEGVDVPAPALEEPVELIITPVTPEPVVELWPEAEVQELRPGCYEFMGSVYCDTSAIIPIQEAIALPAPLTEIFEPVAVAAPAPAPVYPAAIEVSPWPEFVTAEQIGILRDFGSDPEIDVYLVTKSKEEVIDWYNYWAAKFTESGIIKSTAMDDPMRVYLKSKYSQFYSIAA